MPVALVADRNVYELYPELFNEKFPADSVFLFDATEENKILDTACRMYEWLTLRAAKRNMTLVSVGGGITQDVTGFVASTLYRGINWLFVPTTLLAQTDSCIGSKTSLNFQRYKNLIGTFYPPTKLYINTDFYATLSPLDYYSGVGEIIKLQLMKKNGAPSVERLAETLSRCKDDPSFLAAVVEQNLAIKISYMENDEFDRGERNLLNYGHCLGHALETASQYEIPHGIAVNIGIVFANFIALRRGNVPEAYVMELLEKVNLPNIHMELKEAYFGDEELLQAIGSDKKRVGVGFSVVVPDANKKLSKIDDVNEEEFRGGLSDLKVALFHR
jgi:3-dehydroquinate synthase